MHIIRIVLKIKSPSTDETDLDFTEKSDEIISAVNVFNDKYRDWSKRIIVTQITKRAMNLLLVMEKTNIAENLSVREIRYFIQYLRNNNGWNNYTREKHKMFETVEFTRLDKEASINYMNKVISNEFLYQEQKEDVDFLNNVEVNRIMVENHIIDMSDEDMITVLNYLITTQDKGIKCKEKIADISRIKVILNKWL